MIESRRTEQSTRRPTPLEKRIIDGENNIIIGNTTYTTNPPPEGARGLKTHTLPDGKKYYAYYHNRV